MSSTPFPRHVPRAVADTGGYRYGRETGWDGGCRLQYAREREKSFITSGARSAERVLLWFKGEISVCAARPDPTQPDPITLLRSLYHWNGLTDSRAVFFVRCHHSINFVFDRYRYPPVPARARGTCRGEGVEDTLSLGNSTTAGPIPFKFGV